MSLLQLLTTGKALEGVHDSSHRYQMTNQRLLPKFGSKRNPFAAPKTATPAPEPEPAPAPEESSSPAAAVKAPSPNIFSKDAPREPANSRWTGWIAGLKSCLPGWFAKPRQSAPSPVVASRSPAAVQGELSLDGIKVVRNDLSETDLEIVAAKPVAPAGETLAAGTAGAGPEGSSGERPQAWERLRSRLVGAGKN